MFSLTLHQHRTELMRTLFSNRNIWQKIPTASLREQVVRSFGQAVSSEFEIPEGDVEKISKYESPEKWIVKNPEVSVSLREMRTLYDAMQPQLAAVALRILVDAFLKILGYEPAKWTEKETAEWVSKGKDASSIRGSVVKNSNAKLLEAGFTQREIQVLFAASLRTEMNDAAHQMKLGVAASLLAGMDIDPVKKEAVKKAFHYVSGFEIDQVDPKSKDILTTSGISSGHTDDHLFDGEERWAEVGTWG